MQAGNVLASLVALALAGCASAPSEPESGRDFPSCEKVSNVEGLRIYIFSSEGAEKIQYGSNGLTRSPLTDRRWTEVPARGSRWDTKESIKKAFPGNEAGPLSIDEKLVLPAASSPNGRQAVAGVNKKNKSDGAQSAVIRADGMHHRITASAGYSMDAFAWSPDSSRLAVVESNYKLMTRGLRDFVSPHPVPYVDMGLIIYQAPGQPICAMVLVENARYGSSKMEWPSH
jgi:hypothetical protein